MKHSLRSHSSIGFHNMTVVLFTLSCVLICGSLARSLKAQTKRSDEHGTPNSVPGRNGKIAFAHNPGDPINSDIYTTEADGGNVQQLTDSPRHDHSPRWSLEGTKIAFESKRDNDEEIYVMNADGSNQTRLTNNPGYDYSPIFSPDGTRIAFGSRRDNNVEIYVMNADGSNQTRLTNDPADDYSHAWSPDSSRIAFARGGNIYVINADGTNQTMLTTGGSDAFPRWSPDGTRIVFTSGGGTDSAGISVINVDSSNQTLLTSGPFSYYNSLDWSPDGSRIAFVNNPDNNNYNYEIYVINADGSNQTRLTNNPANDHSPVFSPDGTRFAFLSDRDKIDNGWNYNDKIYVMNADGSSQTRLTNTADNVYELKPDWQAIPQAAANPIDTVDFFVRQHYLDFLNREPDTAGLAFWTNEIASCGSDAQCVEAKRVNVSAAFFLSIEFQNTGYLVERVYKAAYGDSADASTGLAVPAVRRAELVADSALVGQGVVVNSPDWDQLLEANKRAYALAFVQRQRFTDAYPPSMTPAAFVAKLNENIGGALAQTEMDALVAELSADQTAEGRASVLRKVAENAAFDAAEKNSAFVLMQYFGYLRRDPDAAPDTNYAGYHFWLAKLDQFNGDFVQAEMVKSFITSTEYRQRFGP